MDQQMMNKKQDGGQKGDGQSAFGSMGEQGDTGLSNLAYDWVTLLHEKTKGLRAYESYIEDARQMNATQCVELLERIRENDRRQVEEIKQHVMQVLGGQMGQQLDEQSSNKQLSV